MQSLPHPGPAPACPSAFWPKSESDHGSCCVQGPCQEWSPHLFRESWGGEREAVLWMLSGDPSLLEGGGLCPTSGDMGRPERWTGCPLCPDHHPCPTPTKELLPSCTQGLHPGWVGDGAGLRAQLRVLQESSISTSSPRGGVWRLSWLDRRAHAPGLLGGCWGSPAPPRVGCALGP